MYHPKLAPSQSHLSHFSREDEYELNAAENVGADYTLKEEPLQNP